MAFPSISQHNFLSDDNMIPLRWIKFNFIYFIIVALLGVIMRSVMLGLNLMPYDHLLHTHSHIAFLGWVYPSLFILLVNRFLTAEAVGRYRFKLQYILTHLLILAMLIAFLLQGYAFYSILFSSLFQLLNYIFVFTFWKALRRSPGKRMAVYFLRIGLLALALSTFGPWTVGALKANGLGGSPFYKMAIYFYLHFQYNGWIIFALMALFFARMDKFAQYRTKQAFSFFILYTLALLPDYCLSLLGLFDGVWLNWLAGLAEFLQILALMYLLPFIWRMRKNIFSEMSGFWPVVPVFIAGLALVIKIILQVFPLLPVLQDVAFNNRGVIVSFIHLVMLGVVSSYLLAEILASGLINANTKRVRSGLILFYSGFVFSELLLGFGFLYFPAAYFELLAAFTFVMFLGLIFLFSGFVKKKGSSASEA